jgi:hypothetical protein
VASNVDHRATIGEFFYEYPAHIIFRISRHLNNSLLLLTAMAANEHWGRQIRLGASKLIHGLGWREAKAVGSCRPHRGCLPMRRHPAQRRRPMEPGGGRWTRSQSATARGGATFIYLIYLRTADPHEPAASCGQR